MQKTIYAFIFICVTHVSMNDNVMEFDIFKEKYRQEAFVSIFAVCLLSLSWPSAP